MDYRNIELGQLRKLNYRQAYISLIGIRDLISISLGSEEDTFKIPSLKASLKDVRIILERLDWVVKVEKEDNMFIGYTRNDQI